MNKIKMVSLILLLCFFISTQTSVISIQIDNEVRSTDNTHQDEMPEPWLIEKNATGESISLVSSSEHIFINHSFYVTEDGLTFSNISSCNDTFFFESRSWLNRPGLPLLPMPTYKIILPKQATIDRIHMLNETVTYGIASDKIQQTPTLHFWSINKTILQNQSNQIIQETIQSFKKESRYPNTHYSYLIGKNTTNTQIILQVYPYQYHWETKTLSLLKKGTLQLSYTLANESTGVATNQLDSCENLIITHPSFLLPAKRLQSFHNNQGIETEIVTTTWIKRQMQPSEYPPMMGYKDFSFRDRIKKYDDVLARKIISFLQQQSTNTQLRYITILGNALHVPPSYYFGDVSYPVPTDFYYCSPDLDLVPNYRIGRLPVHSLLEASKTISKIINWEPASNQMENIAIAGGIPFRSPFFIGEMMTTDSVNRGYFDGLHVDTYFRTNNEFEKKDIITALKQDYALVYIICHGSPFVIAVEEGVISERSLNQLPKSNHAPIISCIACSSGSYDTHVIKQGRKKTSFGEAVVIAKGGGIAYIGGSRTNLGHPLMKINHGRVEILKETYMAGLLTAVNEAYKQNVEYLGDLTFHAYETFLKNNEMDDFWNQYHYLDFILLGDPALNLAPRLFQEKTYQQPKTTATNPLANLPYSSGDEYYNGTILLHAIDEETSYETETDSPFVTVKEIETGQYKQVPIETATEATQNNAMQFSISPKAGEMQLIRVETLDHKEDWIYFKPIRPIDDDYTQETTGFGITRWNNIHDALAHSLALDTIFVFNGTYQESFVIDKPLILMGEEKTTTILDGNGGSDVITITTDGVQISGFTIQHSGTHPGDAGIRISPKQSIKASSILIEGNRIWHHTNCGVFIDTARTRFNPIIMLYNNEIMYNTNGVFISQGGYLKHIMDNIFFGNTYGMYMKSSKKDLISGNTFENNFVGIHFDEVKKESINYNNFINNDQHCQFNQLKQSKFYGNYWDNWIGVLLNRSIPLPKIINGFHDSDQRLISQIKMDRSPQLEPLEVYSFIE